MNHDEIAIPFDVRDLHENIVKRVIEKCINMTKKSVKRLLDIAFSIIVLILLVPMSLMIKLAYMLNYFYICSKVISGKDYVHEEENNC